MLENEFVAQPRMLRARRSPKPRRPGYPLNSLLRRAGMTTKKRPGFPGRFRVQPISAENRTVLGGGLLGRAVGDLLKFCAGADRNAARLLGLGDLADEIDMEQAVLE